jgi:hypothetical protein
VVALWSGVFFTWIDQFPTFHAQKCRQHMLSGCFLAHDVVDMPASDGECVGDEGTVTAPGEGFGTHDRSFLTAGESLKFGKARVKCRGCHIVGIATKGSILPTSVWGVFRGVTQTAKRFEVAVVNAGGLEFAREKIDAKLGMYARSGNGAHIDQELDSVCMQQGQKLLCGMC